MPRKNPKLRKTKVLKSQYLSEVKGRLENDVAVYFERVIELEQTGKHVGYWGSARLIFPVIEAVADTIYRKKRNIEDRPQRLLDKLKVPAPYLVWQMYRNSLMHSDELAEVTFNGKRVSWMIGYGSGDHFEQKGMVSIDTLKLYHDFISFLDKEISSAQKHQTHVSIPTKIHYSRRTTGKVREELETYSQKPKLPIRIGGGIGSTTAR